MSAVLIEFLFPLGDGVDDGGLRLHIAGYRPAARLGAGRHRSRRDRRDVWVNRVLGGVINAFRSVPFIILFVALIPVTRLVFGTSIGTWAANVPLSIAATPYYARIAELSLREVDRGLIEAARAMGDDRWTIACELLVPEALHGLVAGFTVTLVTLVRASAMAGAIGAGGLGDLAIRYGYQRWRPPSWSRL